MKKKLLIVANRLPVRFEKGVQGLRVVQSEGGLATGLASLGSEYNKEWIGWPGIHVKNQGEQQEVGDRLRPLYHPVFLDQSDIDLYYKGFSNETLWPLFHYFTEYTEYKNEYWEKYQHVNRVFCDKVLQVAAEGDTIWVHDYHLMLLPGLLREKLSHRNPIGFFLHIPFPSYELFRTLPWRAELLNGVLGADLIGFHTFEYARHFTDTTYRVLGHESRLGAIQVDGRSASVDTFPMSINFDKFHDASDSREVTDQVREYKKKFGNVRLVLSVDRLDYTKGIINRLEAFDHLLTAHPELREKVSLIMLTVPSRDDVREYKHLKEEVDEMVGRINGRHATLTWTAVHYFYRSVVFDQLVALYNLADIALVTPLRDGMNLVAKEYVASRKDGNGVLILSEMAGAAIELESALRINPNDKNDLAKALYHALHMDTAEQKQRMKKMQEQVRTHSVEKWAEDFTDQLNALYLDAKKTQATIVNGRETAEICAAFTTAENRLIFLDYDGTLRGFCDNPREARPDEALKQLLRELGRHATVVLLSGRDHFTMEEWFGDLGIHLVAEHGIWSREGKTWKQVHNISNAWKEDVYPLLSGFVEKTPGSFIEEKPFSLVFHYRKADSWMAEVRVPQLMSALSRFSARGTLNVVDGNKVIEVRVPGTDKGSAAASWLSRQQWDFIMAMGDDKTDEDMFAAMPEQAYAIKVGSQPSRARWRIRNCEKVLELLRHMSTYAARERAEMEVYKQAV